MDKQDMQAQVEAVKKAREDLADYIRKYGRNSGGASDRRRRLKQAEQKLIEMTISYFETGA